MNAKQLLETMADLEARIAKIYERFATEFHEVADVGDLWMSMGREEVHHAERLSLAAGTAPAATLPPALLEHIGKLEAAVVEAEREVARTVGLQEALRLTADLEEAEAEHLHAPMGSLGEWVRRVVDDPAMQHRQRPLLEHAIRLFGTPEVQQRLAWRRFHD
jgi:hypothetical protein